MNRSATANFSAADLSQLIGMGIDYTGDMANPSGRGAIVATYADTWGAFADLTLEDGRDIPRFSVHLMGTEAQRNGCAVQVILTGPMHGAPYLAQIAAARELLRASKRAADTLRAAEHATEADRLTGQYPLLERGAGCSAANIRRLLKASWPNVKFSVRTERGSSIRIGWTDGPTEAQVQEISDRFEHGHFDGMDDSYHYSRTAWCELFGGVDYVFTNRQLSDEVLTLAIEAAANEFGRKDIPTADDFRQGRAYAITPMESSGSGHWSWQAIIHRTACVMPVE